MQKTVVASEALKPSHASTSVRRNAQDALPLQNDFVADPALALQSDASPFFSEFDNLDADGHHVADFDRRYRPPPGPAAACL